MEEYEITEDTIAIIPTEINKSKIIECDRTIIINQNPIKVEAINW